jgi:hypothetical protein
MIAGRGGAQPGTTVQEWYDITGIASWWTSSHHRRSVEGFLEVFKYAVKFSDQPPADTWHAYSVLKGKRLLGSAGCFRGVEVPDDSTTSCLTICLTLICSIDFCAGGGLSPFLLQRATPSRRSHPGNNSGVSLAWNAADAP